MARGQYYNRQFLDKTAYVAAHDVLNIGESAIDFIQDSAPGRRTGFVCFLALFGSFTRYFFFCPGKNLLRFNAGLLDKKACGYLSALDSFEQFLFMPGQCPQDGDIGYF